MQDRRYMLSISELLVAEELLAIDAPETLWGRCLRWLDGERLGRIRRTDSGGKHGQGQNCSGSSVQWQKMAEQAGAGILLQLAVSEAVTEAMIAEGQNTVNTDNLNVIKLTLSDALSRLEQSGQEPLPLEYIYGENGKPYLKNYPHYFNLSHSGEYIFCMISEKEVGVDIQLRKPLKDIKVAQRFFSESEKKYLQESRSAQERDDRFYRLWACKEAYGKLTGQGIAASVGMDVCSDSKKVNTEEDIVTEDIVSEEYTLEEFVTENYQIAICKRK